jgi:hypothetical protein
MKRLYDRCLRCGQATSWGSAVCGPCNPAGLPSPSPSQYHATVYLSVIAAVAIMAVVFLARG